MQIQCGHSAALLLPMVDLTLIQRSVLYSGDELLRRAGKSGIVCRLVAGKCYHGRLMKIVTPKGIQSKTAAAGRTHKVHVVRLVFADHDDLSRTSRLPGLFRNGRNDVFLRSIEKLLRGIPTKTGGM